MHDASMADAITQYRAEIRRELAQEKQNLVKKAAKKRKSDKFVPDSAKLTKRCQNL